MRLLLLAAALGAAMLAPLLQPAAARAELTRNATQPSEDPSGRLFVSPGRVEANVEPGVASTIRVKLTNDSDEPYDVTLDTSDLGAGASPYSVATQVEDGEFGAGDWLVPEVTDLRIDAFEEVEFDVRVDPPATAPIGTNLAGITVESSPASGEIGSLDNEGMLRSEALIQVFLTVPGPVEHDLAITGVTLRDKLVLGNQRFVVWDVAFRNDGTVNEHVSGNVAIKSLFGNTSFRAPISEMLVMRGSTRTARVVWHDLPWVGAFTPHVKVYGDDAKQLTRTGDRVVILPWWLPVLIVLAVLLPILVLWWRRRQEWKLYLEDEGEDWADQQDGDGAY